mmetsp:Transcript_7401/g.27010  ORF Transcript_7401/g.27010 Transcript_7401/m.27010 type:complete len:212 (+) Transcript_7401:1780-2415(+)
MTYATWPVGRITGIAFCTRGAPLPAQPRGASPPPYETPLYLPPAGREPDQSSRPRWAPPLPRWPPPRSFCLRSAPGTVRANEMRSIEPSMEEMKFLLFLDLFSSAPASAASASHSSMAFFADSALTNATYAAAPRKRTSSMSPNRAKTSLSASSVLFSSFMFLTHSVRVSVLGFAAAHSSVTPFSAAAAKGVNNSLFCCMHFIARSAHASL